MIVSKLTLAKRDEKSEIFQYNFFHTIFTIYCLTGIFNNNFTLPDYLRFAVEKLNNYYAGPKLT